MYYLYLKLIDKLKYKACLPKIKTILAYLIWILNKTAVSTKSLMIL